MSPKIAFIGMGEAGSALITGWGVGTMGEIRVFDIKSTDPETAPEISERCAKLALTEALMPADAVAEADLVFSTVTADQAMTVAAAVAPHLNQGAYFCDLNSCAPSSKQVSAGLIDGAGGRYVDVAVMAPVHPALNMVPLLIGGPHAQSIAPVLEALPMKLRVVEGPVGAASSIKMVRSVLIKGLEALTSEFMAAVKAAGVAEEVLPTLALNYPNFDWDAQATYNFERMMVHGVRRAAEMEEVAKTLDDLGLPAGITRATVEWQRRVAAAPVPAPEDPAETDALTVAEALLPYLKV